MFQKILIANRGEIAVRIIRACREMGILSVAVYSEADREALHTQLADEAVCIGKAPVSDSYLNMERVLSAAIATKSQAIHPGFGFLSENQHFADMCKTCGIAFIGPSGDMIGKMGNKSQARLTMMEAGVPVVPGTKEPVREPERGEELAGQIGYPVMIKASSGGGGKGMRVAKNQEEFSDLFLLAQQESLHAFGDDTMYLEKYMEEPRHIEIQILADQYGNVVWLGERDCSIQRRHQKLLEEAPSAGIDEKLRRRMGQAAVLAAKAVQYENAGTVEFLLDKEKNFYFMEMNTRIQVEHPVTEMVTGVDLVKEQIRIATGEPLHIRQEDIQWKGHAIECRINAEDPKRQFLPCPGKIKDLHFPGGNGVRIESALYNGYQIPAFYDSMVAKVIVHGEDREDAIRKMRSALGEVVMDGITTNLDFQYDILEHPVFLSGNVNTNFIPDYFE
ncbi:MAG: acetyl-CoA carboxylase biotin carboxylase subunit [Lachnospiraceae bacterium]|nr:acetyl-CoA carboxylase biotin carboxylase subunit [Lachnospiraceae bacterium]